MEKSGSNKSCELFGSNKRHEVLGGETQAHDVLGPSNEMRSKILSQFCFAHENLLMVITVQRAATGGAGAKPMLGSANTVWR